jgi:hypothetical protein
VLDWIDNAGVGFHEALAPGEGGWARRPGKGRQGNIKQCEKGGVPVLQCTVACAARPQNGVDQWATEWARSHIALLPHNHTCSLLRCFAMLPAGGRLVGGSTRLLPAERFSCPAAFFNPGADLSGVYAMHMFRSESSWQSLPPGGGGLREGEGHSWQCSVTLYFCGHRVGSRQFTLQTVSGLAPEFKPCQSMRTKLSQRRLIAACHTVQATANCTACGSSILATWMFASIEFVSCRLIHGFGGGVGDTVPAGTNMLMLHVVLQHCDTQ